MIDTAPPQRSRVFHGWIVVAAAFLICFVGFGSAYSFSAFIPPLQREFSASRGSVAMIFSLSGFLYFSFGAVSGPLADRWGSRRLAIGGMVLTGIGLAVASLARSLGELYTAYGLGVGFGIGLALVPALGAVQRWFARRRGFASGIAVSGIGIGTLVVPPVTSTLISHFGWRTALAIVGAIVGVVGAAAALMIENDPAARGLLPDGAPVQPGVVVDPPRGASVRDAVRSRRFIGLYTACLICGLGLLVPFVHIVPYALDHRISQAHALWLLPAIGIGSTAGRFGLGNWADRIGRRHGLMVMFTGIALAFTIWAFSSTVWSLATFAIVFGIFYGGFVALIPALVTDYFGGRNISAIIGILYTSVALGTLVGPTLAGFIFDLRHSYTLPIVTSAIANVVAAVLVGISGKEPARPETRPVTTPLRRHDATVRRAARRRADRAMR